MLLLSYLERRKSTDPNTKGYFEKNGKALGTFFICAVGFWMILLIILPYLYMVIESFHPKLPMKLRGGPTDLVTLGHLDFYEFSAPHLGATVLKVAGDH